VETTEKIVESYCRFVKGMFTITNVPCEGQHEIDLLAVEPSARGRLSRYHIESGVSISESFSKLTAKDFSKNLLKIRGKRAGQRRTLGYFVEHKFGPKEVRNELARHGFQRGNYAKVVVTWGWSSDAKELAERKGIQLWDFREMLKDLGKLCRSKKTHFSDDTLRTLQLLLRVV
jgi:hypothetical protein